MVWPDQTPVLKSHLKFVAAIQYVEKQIKDQEGADWTSHCCLVSSDFTRKVDKTG